MVYKVSSRTARVVTQINPISKKKKKKPEMTMMMMMTTIKTRHDDIYFMITAVLRQTRKDRKVEGCLQDAI